MYRSIYIGIFLATFLLLVKFNTNAAGSTLRGLSGPGDIMKQNITRDEMITGKSADVEIDKTDDMMAKEDADKHNRPEEGVIIAAAAEEINMAVVPMDEKESLNPALDWLRDPHTAVLVCGSGLVVLMIILPLVVMAAARGLARLRCSQQQFRLWHQEAEADESAAGRGAAVNVNRQFYMQWNHEGNIY